MEKTTMIDLSGALIDMTKFQKTTFSFTGDFVCVRVWTGSMN
jgi:hypothetical protein